MMNGHFYPVYKTGITLNELPNHIAFYIQLAECTIHCKGCHSGFLWGTCEHVSIDYILELAREQIKIGADSIIIFGDINNNIDDNEFFILCKSLSELAPVCVYSGASSVERSLGKTDTLKYLSYIKLGGYDDSLGPLNHSSTNQRLYAVNNGVIDDDLTYLFWR